MVTVEREAEDLVRVGEPADSRGRRLARSFGVESAGRMLRDFATYLPTKAVPAIAGFLVLPILARKLDRNDLGIVGIMSTLISLGWTAVGAWCTSAIVRELPAAAAAEGGIAIFRRTLRRSLALMTGLLTAFALLLAIGTLDSRALSENYWLVIAATGGLVLQNIAVTLFAAALRARAYAITEAGARIGGIGLGVWLVFEGHGVSGYLAGLAIGSVSIGAVALLLAWPRDTTAPPHIDGPPPPPPSSALRQWLVYGAPMGLSAVLGWALAFIDRYLLAVLKSWDAAGVYFVGNSLGDKLVSVPMAAFTMAAYPLLVTAFERQGRAEVERLLHAYTRIILLVGIPCVGFLFAAASPLVIVVTGHNYVRYGAAATAAPIVALGTLLIGLRSVAAVGLAVGRRTRYLAMTMLLALAANLALNLALIPWLGILGAAIATPASSAVFLVATAWWSREHARWKFPYGTLARAGVATVLAAEGARIAFANVRPQVTQVGLIAGVGVVAYAVILLVLGERRYGRSVAA